MVPTVNQPQIPSTPRGHGEDNSDSQRRRSVERLPAELPVAGRGVSPGIETDGSQRTRTGRPTSANKQASLARYKSIEVVTTDQRRRRWSVAQKAALVRRTYEAGMTVSLVARQEGVAASLLFQWRKLERQGALTAVAAGEAVVPASELAAARAEIAKLQRVLGKKTLENEILKEAVEYASEKKWIARSPLLPKDDQ